MITLTVSDGSLKGMVDKMLQLGWRLDLNEVSLLDSGLWKLIFRS